MAREGFRSPKWGHLGVYFHCTGPDPSGPRPGKRVQVVVYDRDDKIVRRFEQTDGACVDPGWVDGFNVAACRPAVFMLPLVDIAPDGKVTTLLPDFQPRMGRDLFSRVFEGWVQTHGIKEISNG